ncbi:hypothetical protein SELMODRAFT_441268 [Selaginella moellendorffii]|uniref:TFIIS N-terminal domain-containing protein n=2 Tax=Selaginella moellendorffii TaxID=88036 RepID=D8RI50_SELML|nr:hypothetical protein SELMODRAFT_441268 [Selaginella moellendorffii]
MDKWKSFFQSSGSDIWTVIDRAITIAAVEQPAELRARRDKFTEKMFCPTAHLTGLCECDDGEGEEEENGGGAMSRSDGGDGEEDEDEDEEDDVVENKLVVSGGGALREDEEDLEEEEEVEVVDEEEDQEEEHDDQDDNADQEQSRNRRKSKADCSYMDVEALTDEMEEESRRIKEINRIKNQISHFADEEDYLCEALERLESMHISFEALKATEIGRPVNNLRKHPSLRVRSIVKRLVSGWKTLAEEWTKSAEHFAGGTNATGHFDNNYGLPSPPVDEGELLAAGTAPLEVNKLFDFIEDDMSAGSGDMNEKPRRGSSGDWVRGIYEDAHSPEETKPAAAVSRKTGESEADRKNKQQVSVSRKDSSKNSDSKRSGERESSRAKVSTSQQQNGFRGSQAGGAVAAAANGKHSSGSGSVAAKQQRPDDQRHRAATSNTSRSMKPGVASVSKPKSSSTPLPSASKRSVDERIQSCKMSSSSKAGGSTDKLAAAKRKLHEGYKQAEHAKKQRTVQVMELTDLPKGKGGPKAAKASASSKLHHAQHNNRYNSIHGRRLDQVFGGLGNGSAPSLWSVSGTQLERQQWRPAANSDDEDEGPTCSSSFRSEEEQATKRVRQDENGDENVDEEEEMIRVQAMVGMDTTLDYEDEEDEYDKVAVGREGAGDRLYTSDVKASFDSLSVLSGASFMARDDLASRKAAAADRLAEAREAKINGTTPDLHRTEDLHRRSSSSRPKSSGTRTSDSSDKRKNESRDDRPQKKVRFAVEEENQKTRRTPRDDGGHRQRAGIDRYRNVPHHVRHPEKYTHYTLDWGEEGNSNNVQAWQSTMAAINSAKNEGEEEQPFELPQHVPFVPRANKERAGSSKPGGSTKDSTTPSGSATSVSFAARGLEDEGVAMEENAQPSSKNQKSRSYRSRITEE